KQIKSFSDALLYKVTTAVIDQSGKVILQTTGSRPVLLPNNYVFVQDSVTYIFNPIGEKKILGTDEVWLTNNSNYVVTQNSANTAVPLCKIWTMEGELVTQVERAQIYQSAFFSEKNEILTYPISAGNFIGGFSYVSDINLFMDKSGNLYENNDINVNDYCNHLGDFEPSPFLCGVAVMTKNESFGILDSSGTVIVPFGTYTFIEEFYDDMALAQRNGLYVFLNPEGKEISLPGKLASDQSVLTETPTRFHGGFTKISWSDKKGNWILFMNKTGNYFKLNADLYDQINEFSEGLCAVKPVNSNLWGFIDHKGKMVIPATLEFDDVYFFSEGLCAVEKEGKFGFIDNTGKLIIPLIYNYATDFYNRLAVIENPLDSDMLKLIDKSGEIMPYSIQFKDSWQGDYRIVYDNETGKCGVINKTGKLIIACTYNRIRLYACGLAFVSNSSIDQNIWFMPESADVYQTGGFVNLKTGVNYFN
ncbi:MAG: WG repeat-containing protein, partial [Crocinitomicaceae bacterium]|nr:WG repeat-containing protein [Crocinitomicaceae bacterium]